MDDETINRELRKRGSGDLVGLSLEEKRQILQALQESEKMGSDVEITGSSYQINGSMDEDAAIKAAIEQSLSESQPVDVPNIDEGDQGMVRRAPMKREIAARLGIEVPQLEANWSSLVGEMRMFDGLEKNRYVQQIKKACEEIGPEPSSGILVAVVLPQGNRITRKWSPEASVSSLYVWCAASDKMAVNLQRIGHFVIVDIQGDAIDPNGKIGDVFNEAAVQLNVWLL